jgi:hypothetical protein
MLRVEDSDIWDIIELKRPQHSLTVRNQGTEKVSAAAARAIAELLQYRDFFSIRNDRRRIMHRFGTAPYEPCLVLVIGRGRSTERYEWRTAFAGFPVFKLFPTTTCSREHRIAAGFYRRSRDKERPLWAVFTSARG